MDWYNSLDRRGRWTVWAVPLFCVLFTYWWFFAIPSRLNREFISGFEIHDGNQLIRGKTLRCKAHQLTLFFRFRPAPPGTKSHDGRLVSKIDDWRLCICAWPRAYSGPTRPTFYADRAYRYLKQNEIAAIEAAARSEAERVYDEVPPEPVNAYAKKSRVFEGLTARESDGWPTRDKAPWPEHEGYEVYYTWFKRTPMKPGRYPIEISTLPTADAVELDGYANVGKQRVIFEGWLVVEE